MSDHCGRCGRPIREGRDCPCWVANRCFAALDSKRYERAARISVPGGAAVVALPGTLVWETPGEADAFIELNGRRGFTVYAVDASWSGDTITTVGTPEEKCRSLKRASGVEPWVM